MLVQYIKEAPTDLFNTVLEEIKGIDWEAINNPIRNKTSSAFASSRAILLRRQVVPQPIPETLRDWGKAIPCEDIAFNIEKYPNVYALTKWMQEQVGGVELGKIMVVRLNPRAGVIQHVDDYEYFEYYSRFHVPLVTNPNVVFSGDGSPAQHMPAQMLCRLNNRALHQVDNNSDEYRIHLLVDIRISEDNSIFM